MGDQKSTTQLLAEIGIGHRRIDGSSAHQLYRLETGEVLGSFTAYEACAAFLPEHM